MATYTGPTGYIHSDPAVQREFERVRRYTKDADKRLITLESNLGGIQGQLNQVPKPITVTSQDESITIKKDRDNYDLSVWNYATGHYYTYNNAVSPYNVIQLPTNRTKYNGWIPMRSENPLFEDRDSLVRFIKTTEPYEPFTDIDAGATGRANSLRPWYCFHPQKAGIYHFDVAVRMKVAHVRALATNYIAITNAILMAEKTKYSIVTDPVYNSYMPDYHGIIVPASVGPPPVLEHTEGIIKHDYYYAILDERHRFNYSNSGTWNITSIEDLMINNIFLTGSIRVRLDYDDCMLFWYKFHAAEYYNPPGVWALHTYFDLRNLYERIDVRWDGLDGRNIQRLPDVDPIVTLKETIEMFDISTDT